jgi:HrpA-like RNA helicase
MLRAVQRCRLPVDDAKDEVVAAVKANSVVVIIGETGSGKTTQIPQILLDSGVSEGAVVVTQPRRVAAISCARRVASERGVRIGEEVGYTIRFEDVSSAKTTIKFATDGTS